MIKNEIISFLIGVALRMTPYPNTGQMTLLLAHGTCNDYSQASPIPAILCTPKPEATDVLNCFPVYARPICFTQRG